eukprot:1730261-Alexandrium_andersonii.AAC.1
MPESIKKRLRECPSDRDRLFNLWLQSGEDFGKVVVFEEHRRENERSFNKKRRWLFECQLQELGCTTNSFH